MDMNIVCWLNVYVLFEYFDDYVQNYIDVVGMNIRVFFKGNIEFILKYMERL